MTADLTPWQILLVLCVIPAAVGYAWVRDRLAARRSPGDVALDPYEAQP